MPRLVVVLPLSPLRDGDSFAVQEWPLHITAVPPFLTDAAPAEIAAAIASAASAQTALTAVAGRDEMFGRRKDVPVTVVAENEALTRLHRTLLDAVRPFAASPDEPAFTGLEFRPHITFKKHGRVHEGDEFSLTQIALVDMAPRSAPGGRSVLATLPLPAPGIAGERRRLDSLPTG
jgi:2'-5' RNA ligase